MNYRLGFLFLTLLSTSASAQELEENPWLHEHFSISFKSRETFRLLDRIAADAPIRKAVWDYPLAQMLDVSVQVIVGICENNAA